MGLLTLVERRAVMPDVGMRLRVLHPHSPIESLVGRPAVRVHSDDSLAIAGRVMRSHNVSAALVGAGHRAIVTERDITRAVAEDHLPDAPVSEVATPLPVTVSGEMTVVAAAAVMLNQEVRHLVVESPDGTVGIVSIRDVMAVLLQSTHPELWLASLRMKLDVPIEAWPD